MGISLLFTLWHISSHRALHQWFFDISLLPLIFLLVQKCSRHRTTRHLACWQVQTDYHHQQPSRNIKWRSQRYFYITASESEKLITQDAMLFGCTKQRFCTFLITPPPTAVCNGWWEAEVTRYKSTWWGAQQSQLSIRLFWHHLLKTILQQWVHSQRLQDTVFTCVELGENDRWICREGVNGNGINLLFLPQA
jgi:hypothetical protein